MCVWVGGVKLWTIKPEWQEGARRNVQNIGVIYEHMANRCGGVIGTPSPFINLDHICVLPTTPQPQVHNMLY